MTVFWLIVAVMVIIAAAVVLMPVWRYRPQAELSRDETNARIFRERLADLDLEFQEQRIDDAQYRQLRADLERTLLVDVPQIDSTETQENRLTVKLAGGIALLVPLLALGYYYMSAYRGDAQDWIALQNRLNHMVMRAVHQPEELPAAALEDLPNFTRVLQSRVLREGMNDPDGLFLLGVSFIRLQLPEQALTVLNRALELAPDRADIMLTSAQAMIMANDGRLSEPSAELLKAVLAINPDHRGALMILGFGAFNGGDYEIALTAWRPLLASLDPNSEAAQLLQGSIDRAQRMLASAKTSTPPAEASTARIAVTVDLSPELQERLSPQATLFVFAKAANGPAMPLAVVKQPAKTFPMEAVLDDNQAMMPSLKLSDFQQVTVTARISNTGDVTAKPGDLQGFSQPLSLVDGPQSVALMVDQVVPPAATTQIAITVALAPELQERLSPQDTLFVFAKAASGPPMPLAAVKQTAKEFPVQVVLDDSQAMMPSLKLSNFQDVVVSARISKGGDVSAKPGDLQSASTPLNLQNGPLSVSLIVDQVVQ